MFFSGEPAGSSTGAGTKRSLDLASDMARDAQSRRAAVRRSKSSAGAARRTADSAEAAAGAGQEVENPAEAPSSRAEDLSSRAEAGSTVEPEGIAAQAASPAQVEASGEELAERAATDAFGSDDAVMVSDRSEVQKPRAAADTRPDSDSTPSGATDAHTDSDGASVGSDDVPADSDTAPAGAAGTSDDDAGPAADPAADVVLDASELVAVPGAEFAELPINEIRENPRNPRTVFDEDALDELAFSLREVGVLQPVVVRPIAATDTGESFELVMGERRWRAAQRAGLASIPAIIRDTSDDDLLRDALLENLHRSQLNPLEEAAAYAQLLEDFGSTQEELAERIGRSRPQITNTLRLLKLPPLVQRRVASGALSAGHARALLSLDDSRLQEELAARIVAEGLSVRAVERLISSGSATGQRTSTPRRTTYNPTVVNLTSKISNRFEAPVRIDVGKRKGKITFEFTNLEDLERLAGLLGIEDSDLDGSR